MLLAGVLVQEPYTLSRQVKILPVGVCEELDEMEGWHFLHSLITAILLGPELEQDHLPAVLHIQTPNRLQVVLVDGHPVIHYIGFPTSVLVDDDLVHAILLK